MKKTLQKYIDIRCKEWRYLYIVISRKTDWVAKYMNMTFSGHISTPLFKKNSENDTR